MCKIDLKSTMRLTATALVLLSTILLIRAQALGPRLRRPERLHNAEQLSNYLKELQEYYSVHGRGRYGKRQMHIADASVIFREVPLNEHNLNEDPLWKNLANTLNN
ncbi:unnamed protein product [Plutella xylostella]|uniref:(diamondback moth) hypothetical protein n=1 Tax=Plutella xylostella TaxID=51655 RepID=A0A8S4G1J7_PLUXY|nr:unnamed protein product [Plutella xylostella]